MVTKYKLGYDPVEVDPEDMVRPSDPSCLPAVPPCSRAVGCLLAAGRAQRAARETPRIMKVAQACDQPLQSCGHQQARPLRSSPCAGAAGGGEAAGHGVLLGV